MFSVEGIKDYTLNTMTVGMYGMVIQDVEAVQTVQNEGVKRLGKVAGETVFDVTAVAVTNGLLKNVKVKSGTSIEATTTMEVATTTSTKGMANPKVAAAVAAGKKAHKEIQTKAAAKGWKVEEPMVDPKTGKTVRADIVIPSGHPIEIKPNTPSGKAKGATQIKQYERATGTNGRVIYYDPKKL